MDKSVNYFGKSNTIQALWVGLGSLSSFGLAIISAAILSRYFDKEEYGTYRQIIYVYSTLLVVFTAGLPRVFGYFLPRYTVEEGKTIVHKITKLLFFAGMIFSIFLFLVSNLIADFLNNKELAYGLKVFSPIPMFLLPTLGLGGIFATYKITIYTAIYNTLSRLIMLLFIVVPVIFFKGSYINAIYGWLVASVITFFIAFFFKSIPFKKVIKKNTKLTYNEIFNYSIPLVIASLWGIAIKASDQFYISRYFGAEVFAEFSNGFMEIPIVTMVTASASAVLMPVFSKILHENTEKKELGRVWKSVLLKSAYIIYPIIVFCLFKAADIIRIIYSDIYIDSTIYFQIRMFLNFFNIIIFAPLIFAMGETKFYAYVHAFITCLAWLGGYTIVSYFNSPIILAIYSVSLSIIKILILFGFIFFKLKFKFSDMIPYQTFFKILCHTTVVIYIIDYVFDNTISMSNDLMSLLFQCCMYFMIILISSKLIGLEYLMFLKPLIKGKLNFLKSNNSN